MASPLAVPEAWNLVAPHYDEIVRPMFRAFSAKAIELLQLGTNARVLDCACGPGTATELLLDAGHRVDAIDFSANMVSQLKARLAERSDAQATPHVMDGQRLEFDTNSFDGAMSMFGLMFFPDRHCGFGELLRVLRPGARACVSSWWPLSKVPVMQWGFGAFGKIVPPPPPDAPPRVPVLEDEETIQKEMTDAGFVDVQVISFEAPMPVTSVEEFWEGFVRSGAPIALFRSKVGEEAWAQKSEQALAILRETAPSDLSNFTLGAFLAVGRKASE